MAILSKHSCFRFTLFSPVFSWVKIELHRPKANTVVCKKSIENFVFRPKMTIFRRAGMRKGGLPLVLANQYLIFMI